MFEFAQKESVNDLKDRVRLRDEFMMDAASKMDEQQLRDALLLCAGDQARLLDYCNNIERACEKLSLRLKATLCMSPYWLD
jgi:hypothetical protein